MSRALQAVPALALLAAVFFAGVGALSRTLTAPVTAEGVEAMRATYPAQSLYALDAGVETSTGENLPLAALGGEPRIATMFYAHCASMCPIVLRNLQQLDASLAPAERGRLSFLMLSLDPAHDSLQVLKQHADAAKVAADRWTIGRTAAGDVSRVAERLGIRYRALASGELDHTSELILLDAQGRVVARTSGLALADEAFMTALRGVLASGAAR